MAQPIYQVDSFTSKPFGGNPAGVCPLDGPRAEPWMQAIAAEMNVAETAFLTPHADGYGLRWFTPTVEVDLCGHATLASAHILWESERLARTLTARFHTKSGLLTARPEGDWISLDFPATPAEPIEPPEGLAEALGVQAAYTGRSRFDYLAEVESEETVRGLSPNFSRLRGYPVRGIIVTARAANRDYDFVSRFFAPATGVDEDPATGSSHCCLALYWRSKLGKSEMEGRQLSSRGGVIRVRCAGDRVILLGQAVTVLRGEVVTEG